MAYARDRQIEARALLLARHLRQLPQGVQDKLIDFVASLTRA